MSFWFLSFCKANTNFISKIGILVFSSYIFVGSTVCIVCHNSLYHSLQIHNAITTATFTTIYRLHHKIHHNNYVNIYKVLTEPMRAGHVEAFWFLSVCLSVGLSFLTCLETGLGVYTWPYILLKPVLTNPLQVKIWYKLCLTDLVAYTMAKVQSMSSLHQKLNSVLEN